MSALRQPTPPPDPPSVAALASTPPDVLKAIREAYTFTDENDEAVALGIVAQRPDIAAVLFDALPHVRKIFGDTAQVMLISVDEYTDVPLRLSARIVTTESVPDARAKRDAFYRAWWLSVPAEIDEALSLCLIWPRDT